MIEHMDNCSIYGGTNSLLLNGIYAQQNINNAVDPDGISGGRVFRHNNDLTNGQYTTLRYALSTGATAKVGVAERLWLASLPPSDNATCYPVIFRTVGNAELARLGVASNGALYFIVNGIEVARTALPVVTANGWWHIEVEYSTAGAGFADYEVRVEGLTVLQGAGVAAVASQAGQVAWGARNVGEQLNGTWYTKDIVIRNGLGTYNTGWLGSVLVHNLVPTADVALNWTPTPAGTGYTILDNIPPNGAQFITAPNPPPAAYVCSLSDLPADVTSVKGIMSFVRAAKTDGGDGSLQNSVISNGDTANGADRPITVAQTYWRDLFETDPDTAAPWTPAAVNAVQLQINRTL